MNFAKVVVGEMERNRVRMHFDLLTKAVREASKPAHVHPHGEVLALDERCRDVMPIRVPSHNGALGSGELRWAITNRSAVTAGRHAVMFFQHRVVNVDTEGVVNGIQVNLMSIGRQLHAVRQTVRNIFHEVIGGRGGSRTDSVSGDQFRVGIDSSPCPAVAPLAALRFWDVLLFRANERPNFITLNPLGLQAANRGVVMRRARGAQVAQQLLHGHTSHASNARCGPQAIAFHQHRNHPRSVRCAQSIHNRQYTCSAMYCQVSFRGHGVMSQIIEGESTHPGVGLAYEFVIPSYGWLLTRLEAADNRIQTLQVVAATFTAAIPAAAKTFNPNVVFERWQFIWAMLAFCVVLLIGVVARVRGGITLANPSVLWKEYLRFQDWEFKKTALYWAGQHFEKNGGLINQKARAAVAMTVVFGVEMLLLASWVITSTILP